MRAQVTDVLRSGATASNLGLSSVHAVDTLNIDSDANLRSRSTNVAGSIGLFTGTATINYTIQDQDGATSSSTHAIIVAAPALAAELR